MYTHKKYEQLVFEFHHKKIIHIRQNIGELIYTFNLYLMLEIDRQM